MTDTRETRPRIWLIARKRDTEPWEVNAFDRYDEAAMFFDAAQQQWSTVYFCSVAHCEGRPLDVTPVIHGFKDKLQAAEARIATLEAERDEMARELALFKKKARDAEADKYLAQRDACEAVRGTLQQRLADIKSVSDMRTTYVTGERLQFYLVPKPLFDQCATLVRDPETET